MLILLFSELFRIFEKSYIGEKNVEFKKLETEEDILCESISVTLKNICKW